MSNEIVTLSGNEAPSHAQGGTAAQPMSGASGLMQIDGGGAPDPTATGQAPHAITPPLSEGADNAGAPPLGGGVMAI